MTKEQLQAGLRRFLKGFIAGGLASVMVFLATGTPVQDFADIQNLRFPLAMAFLTGGLQSIQKMLSWKELPKVE